MDDVCGSEGSCGVEIPQISDLESDLKENKPLEEMNPSSENIFNQEISMDLENLEFNIQTCENGESAAESKVSLQYEPTSDCRKAIMLTSQENKDSLKDKIVEDVMDDMIFTQSNKEIQELNDAIDKALEKHLDAEEEFACESGLSNDGDSDSKEASVQTALDQFTSNESCPICRLEKAELKNDLTALCLEYPPYKKRRLNKSNVNTSISEIGFAMVEDTSEYNEREELRRKKVSSDEQIVPNCTFQTDIIKGQNAEFSSRSIRVGLSKRVKPRPLHQVPKLQAKDSEKTDS